MRSAWYLSFAGEEGWRGCAIIMADSFLDAVVQTHQLKINPGGEIRGWEMPAEIFLIKYSKIPVNKLFTELNVFEQILGKEDGKMIPASQLDKETKET